MAATPFWVTLCVILDPHFPLLNRWFCVGENYLQQRRADAKKPARGAALMDLHQIERRGLPRLLRRLFFTTGPLCVLIHPRSSGVRPILRERYDYSQLHRREVAAMLVLGHHECHRDRSERLLTLRGRRLHRDLAFGQHHFERRLRVGHQSLECVHAIPDRRLR